VLHVDGGVVNVPVDNALRANAWGSDWAGICHSSSPADLRCRLSAADTRGVGKLDGLFAFGLAFNLSSYLHSYHACHDFQRGCVHISVIL
jgi:hypothetical protein